MKRVALALIVSAVASVTACNDVTTPENSRTAAIPSRPSLVIEAQLGPPAITYDVPGGTFRIYDLKIVAPEGRVEGQRAWVNPNSPITFSGKWEVPTGDFAGFVNDLRLTWQVGSGNVSMSPCGVVWSAGTQGRWQ